MDQLEECFNRQSDVFWAWGSLRRRRPSPEDEIDAGAFLRLLPFVIGVALALIALTFALGAASDVAAAGTLLSRAGGLAFLGNLRGVFTIIGLRVVFLTLFVTYGLALLSLPYAFFWNRRARRRRRTPAARESLDSVWPPPPNVPGRR